MLTLAADAPRHETPNAVMRTLAAPSLGGSDLSVCDLALRFEWYSRAMRTTIDAAGRLVVPKRLRDQLGFAPGTELELDVVDGRLEVAVPTRVRLDDGPHGPRFTAEADEKLSAQQVRALMESGRR